MSEKSVFSPLVKLTPRAFTETAYQVSILLRHRRLLTASSTNQVLDRIRVNGIIKTNSTLKQNLNESIKRIEEAEGMSLAQIPDDEIIKYQQELSGLIAQKTRDASGPATLGKVILERLRKVEPSRVLYFAGHGFPSESKGSSGPSRIRKTPSSLGLDGRYLTQKSEATIESQRAVASVKKSKKAASSAKATLAPSKSRTLGSAKGAVTRSRPTSRKRSSVS